MNTQSPSNGDGLAPLAISLGEPAGVGADLILQLFSQRKALNLPPFLVYGNLSFLRRRAERLGFGDAIELATTDNSAEIFAQALPVFDMGKNIEDSPGISTARGARMVIDAIECAVADCLEGQSRGLVTAPINKAAVQKIGFEFPGHTEFLAHLCASEREVPTAIMMLAHESLRVVPLTIHVALAKVPKLIKQAMIVEHVQIIARDLKNRFGIQAPRIAVTGLNPHAGEEGAFGLEDIEEIIPAIRILQQQGIEAHGPFPADTAFHLPNWHSFDVVVAMYHDQALIPIKTVAFDEAVNVTLGLPIVRTSPDHGTAYDLAGSGKASTKSMLAAIRLADKMSVSTVGQKT